MSLLDQIIDATAKDGSVDVQAQFKSHLTSLAEKGLIEINPATIGNPLITVRALTKEVPVSTGLTIENIPVTKPARGPGLKPREKKYPELASMDVGQSVFIPGLTLKQGQAVATGARREFGTQNGEKTSKTGKVRKTFSYSRDFAANAVDGGVRVGRVS